jgi:hypothetical protein
VTSDEKTPPVPAALRRERMLAEIQEREYVRVGDLSAIASACRR